MVHPDTTKLIEAKQLVIAELDKVNHKLGDLSLNSHQRQYYNGKADVLKQLAAALLS